MLFRTIKLINLFNFQLLKSQVFKSIALTFSLSLLVSCASQTVAISENVKIESVKAASEASFTPEQAIADAEKQLNTAYDADLTFFSPLHLKQASESIIQAKAYLSKPPKGIKNAALMSAIAAQKFIIAAYKNKTTIKSALHKSLAHLQVLIKLKAPSIIKSDYQDVLDKLINLISTIEQGHIPTALKQQADLINDMAQVEISTLKKIHLNLTHTFIAKAEQVDADKFAEASFKQAEKKLEAANNYINKNYRNLKGIKKITDEALLAAKQAYFVALESKQIVQLSEKEAEKHTLNYISLLNRIHVKVHDLKLKPQDLNSASNNIAHTVENLMQQIKEGERALKIQIDEYQKFKESLEPELDSENKLPEDEKLEIQTLPEQHNEIYSDNERLIQPPKNTLLEDEQGFDIIENMGSEDLNPGSLGTEDTNTEGLNL